MICEVLYLPDYPIGHFIGFQIEAQMNRAGHFGRGVRADGEVRQRGPRSLDAPCDRAPVGAEAILAAAQQALAEVGETKRQP